MKRQKRTRLVKAWKEERGGRECGRSGNLDGGFVATQRGFWCVHVRARDRERGGGDSLGY